MKLSIAILEAELNEEFKNAIDSFVTTRKTKVTTKLAMVRQKKIVNLGHNMITTW